MKVCPFNQFKVCQGENCACWNWYYRECGIIAKPEYVRPTGEDKPDTKNY